MRIYPAIDLLGGKAVRLREGRRDEATVYSDAPEEVARGFLDAGAARIHVVDLDGAFSGRRENRLAVERILATGARVQLGGGIRDLDTCRRLLADGVERVVVGTLAARDPAALSAAAGTGRDPGDAGFLSHLVVAVDARDGRVFVEGWDVATGLDAFELATTVAGAGVAAVLYTDIARDGTGHGANVESTARMARALSPTEVIASGGIASLDDLAALARAGVPAAVVGRALYQGAFTLRQAIEVAARASAGAPC